ncbi:hypothetical protein [Ligilactobacillus sp. 110_WCHN]|uniref:hypothetical protein n=1 Tax=Ligilactobacillus sp. 110_WCHN TaxID=3057125 RepID=UPI0026739B01|nr:hypothetical protein [Ligilactobacillus sp. 110_WCHN]MDO3394055.1 hypothetical protein [Ligilactobacillus sp. 110_WCHN]
MKKLNLLDQSSSFKVNDTGTIIPFNAFEDNQPFSVTADDATPIFRIKNEMGFLKSVSATVAVGGYIFQLNTKDLVDLVPGTYQVELVVTDSKTNEEQIFPDTGFCSFNITDSAMTVTGTQIPTMSLDSFKNELQQYVENQAESKLQTIESDFQTYVDNLKDSMIKQAQQASSDAQNAIKTANGAVTTANAASTLASAASSLANQALTKLQQPIGGRNLLLDSRSGNGSCWIYKNMNNANMTFMGCPVGKVNQAWYKAIGAYDAYDLYQRGLYNTNDYYTFSCYAKIDGSIKLRKGDIRFYCTAADATGGMPDISKVNSDSWEQISITFKFTEDTPNKNDGTQSIRFEPNVSWSGSGSYQGVGTGYLYLACPQLEKGATASDYRPAPEDNSSDIQQMQSQIVALTQQIATLQTK